jgi:hypothetical protein
MKLGSKEYSEIWGYWTPNSVLLITLMSVVLTASLTGFIAFTSGRVSGYEEFNSPHKMVCINQSDTQVVCTMVPKEVNE